MVAQRLTIDGDITRFVNDTFPHKVTIYLKDKQITCSGLVLSYHSSVLENKILEENGEFMFDEMHGDENNDDHLENCINLLHGQAFSDINMDFPSVNILLKFSMWYKVDTLFELALELLDKQLPAVVKTDEEFTDLFSVYRICNTLQDHPGYQRIKQLLLTRISVSNLTRHFEDNGDQKDLSGYDIAAIIFNTPDDSGRLLLMWVKLSSKNQLFILDHLGLFSFNLIFPERFDFDEFISVVSSNESMAVEKFRSLLNIQQQYLTANTVEGSLCLASPQAAAQKKKRKKKKDTVDDAVPSSSGVSNISQECSKPELKDEDEKPATCDERIVHLKVDSTISMSDVICMIQGAVQGRIRLIKLNKYEGTGIVEFDSIEDGSKFKKHLLASDNILIKPECCVAGAEPDCKNLWVQNLPKNISEKGLRDFLSDCGGINKIEIKRFQKQAHAYVHFICPQYVKNVLIKALQSPDEARFGKSILQFKPINKDSWSMEELQIASASGDNIFNVTWLGVKEFPYDIIHIYGIHRATTRNDLETLFEQFGGITAFRVYQKSQVAYIQFDENESARKTITFYRHNKLLIKGQYAYVELCHELSSDDLGPSIIVRNIPVGVTKEYVKGIFNKITCVNSIIVELSYMTAVPLAVVTFDCTCDRDIALAYYRENPSVLEVNGNTLKLVQMNN